MKNMLVFCFLFLFVFPALLAAQPNPKASATTNVTAASQTASVPPPTSQNASTPLSEKDYYKLLAEQAASSAERASTLTQWVVGITLALVAVFLTVQAAFTFFINKDKLETLARDLRAEISSMRVELREFQQTTQQNIAAINTTLADTNLQVRNLTNSQQATRLIAHGDFFEKANVNYTALRAYLDAAKTEITEDGECNIALAYGLRTVVEKLKRITAEDLARLNPLVPIIKKHDIMGGVTLAIAIERLVIVTDQTHL